MRFADLPPGFVIAHRGGALQVPEHTLEGYRVAVGQGLPVIEQDVHVLADGGLGVMHDGTVDRTTSSHGNVADHTCTSWKQLDVDAGTYLGGGWGDELRPPLFEEVLTEFGDRVLLCPEAKSADAMGPLLDALERRGTARASVLVQSFALADCRLAVARGWDVVWLGSTDVARAVAEGVRWLGPAAGSVTAAVCEEAHAAGVRVACHTVNRRWRRDALRAHGVDAIFSDDPLYLHSDAVRRRSDLFARQVWVPGMQADGDTRGRFHADDASYGFELAGAAASWALAGYLAPSDPAAFTLDLALRVDRTHHDDPSGGGSVVLTTTDRPVTGAPVRGAHGYGCVLERSGRLRLERVTHGVAVPLARTQAGAPAPLGGYVPLRVEVTATTVSLARRDTGEAVAATDAAHRPLPFLHLGRQAAGVRYREVVFS